MKALSVYESSNSEFSFIISKDKTFKKTIMYELGRLEDEDLIKTVARAICTRKMKSKDAVNYIKEFRLPTKQADTHDLALKLSKVLLEYRETHETQTFDYVGVEFVESAIYEALDLFLEKIS